ncbi:MAG: type II secretion system F family protein [Candidatus Sumerlaea chitinivorans]|nr:type II secretion system F family protein [Candidatus Sumerlaea chitinivorans]
MSRLPRYLFWVLLPAYLYVMLIAWVEQADRSLFRVFHDSILFLGGILLTVYAFALLLGRSTAGAPYGWRYQFYRYLGAACLVRGRLADATRAFASSSIKMPWRVRRLLLRASKRLEVGASLAETLKPTLFRRAPVPVAHLAVISAAEDSDSLPEALQFLASEELVDREHGFSRKVWVGIIVGELIVFSFILGLFAIQTLPRIAELYEDLHKQPPVFTQQVVRYSVPLWQGLVLLLVLLWGIRFLERRSLWVRRLLANRSERLVELLWLRKLARFAHTLGMLLKWNVDLLSAFDSAVRATGDPVLQRRLPQLRERIKVGVSLPNLFAGIPSLPTVFHQLLMRASVSETAPEVLCAGAYELQQKWKLQQAVMTQLVAAIVHLAVLAFGIILVSAIYLSLFSIVNAVPFE